MPTNPQCRAVTSPSAYIRPRRVFRRSFLAVVAVSACILHAAGCNQLATILGDFRLATAPKVATIALVTPFEDATIRPGATVRVEWADTAYVVPTTVRAEALRLDATNAVIETIVLADGRDAFADGQADSVEFDTTGRPVGRFQFRVTLAAPDAEPIVQTTTVVITVQ